MIKWFFVFFVVSYFIISLPNIFGMGYVIDWVPEATLFQKIIGYLLEGLKFGFIIKVVVSIMIGIVGSKLLIANSEQETLDPKRLITYHKGVGILGKCELCGRDQVETTVHHLLPKEMGGTFGATANLCIPCHKQIHALYTNQEIAARLTTLQELREDEQLSSFIKWIRKQPPTKIMKIKKSNSRKRK